MFVVGMVTTLVAMASSALFLDGSNDWIFRFFQLFGVLGLFGVLIGPWDLAKAWRDQSANWWTRTTGAALAAALIIVPVLGIALHLLTLSLDY
ncbi:MAG: hypothetical protein EOO77_22780 [Oxalobacteraceae bacterium]|nr:MAG: hypothetical protein EOO77_22780 [Oxalobacteraceae bacterium]